MNQYLDAFAHRVAKRFESTVRTVDGDIGPANDTPSGSASDVSLPVTIWRPGDRTTLFSGSANDDLAAQLASLRAAASVVLIDLPASLFSGTPASTLGEVLAAAGHAAEFVGDQPPVGQRRVLAIIRGDALPAPEKAPDSFRVAAIMTAFNEQDIVGPSIERLIAQGIDVYLLDNWSEDNTASLVEDLVGHGLIAIEQFPPGGRPENYEWTQLLRRVTEIAASLDHDWIVHHDVDQRLESPWDDLAFRDALHSAELWGFNAVDHTILEFRPIDDGFPDGAEISDYHHYFELVPAAATATHVQAWKNTHSDVDLESSGGHDALFEGRRVFPFNFTLRHYPIRSQRHGDLKVFRDRKPRYRSEEMDKGWHYHYARMRSGHQFIRNRADLIEWQGPRTNAELLLPRLGQIGMQFPEPSRKDRARAVGVDILRRTRLGPTYVRVRTQVLKRFN